MITRDFAMWFCIGGTLTSVIGIYRGLRNKQSSEPDELTSFSWFLLWFIWLPVFIVRWVKYRLKGKKI